jgi:hypothetical protein
MIACPAKQENTHIFDSKTIESGFTEHLSPVVFVGNMGVLYLICAVRETRSKNISFSLTFNGVSKRYQHKVIRDWNG